MFNLEHIQKVGLINMGGGILALILGTGVWTAVAPNTSPTDLIANALIAFFIFAGSWFLLRMLVTLQLFNNISKGLNYNKTDMAKLKELPKDSPNRKGIPYLTYELVRLVLALALVVGATFFLSEVITVSLGGFVGGWLAGSGLGKFFFARRLILQEVEQQRKYYFSDPDLGPYTVVSFYSTVPESQKPAEPTGLVELKKPLRSTGPKAKAQPLRNDIRSKRKR